MVGSLARSLYLFVAVVGFVVDGFARVDDSTQYYQFVMCCDLLGVHNVPRLLLVHSLAPGAGHPSLAHDDVVEAHCHHSSSNLEDD